MLACGPCISLAEPQAQLRIATFAAPLSRDGPGLLLRDILAQDDDQLAAIFRVINVINPDVLVLTNFDYDAGGVALSAFSQSLARPFPFQFSLAPNAGQQAGLDLNQNGRLGEPADALGYGQFFGDGGLAILSMFPFDNAGIDDFSSTIWSGLPWAELPRREAEPFYPIDIHEILPLSSTAHWKVPVQIPEDHLINLLVFSATPPVFDGPEDRNGFRNRDEIMFLGHLIDSGDIPAPFVVAGNTNLDPFDGEGWKQTMGDFLLRPDIQDPRPSSLGGAFAPNNNHMGDPGLDTVQWPQNGPGNLRVSYVLPSVDLQIVSSGVFWPAPDTPFADLLGEDGLAAGAHRLVWVDLTLPANGAD